MSRGRVGPAIPSRFSGVRSVDRIEQLASRAVAGDSDALIALLKECGPEVRSSLAIGQPWQAVVAADDVMQVTYMEAFLQIRHFTPRGPGSFLAWLRRIAENNLRDAVRELERDKRPDPRKRVDPPGGDDSATALYQLLGGTTSTPSRAAARREAIEALENAIGQLPPDYAKVVRLYDLDGCSGSEVASAMGRSVGAVKMLAARAHDRLQAILGTGSQFFGNGA